eukprot:3646602-Prorocentrum_lima.AAC.1
MLRTSSCGDKLLVASSCRQTRSAEQQQQGGRPPREAPPNACEAGIPRSCQELLTSFRGRSLMHSRRRES